jgi:hypothetical protein
MIWINPIAPPVDLPRSPWAHGGWIVGVAIGIALLGVAWYRRTVRRRVNPWPGTPMAHEMALQALDQIFAEPDLLPNYPNPIFQGVIRILRDYLQDRYGLSTAERTTAELLANLAAEPRLASHQKQRLQELFAYGDCVKFAALCPPPDTARDFVECCRQFITETKPREEE